MPTKKKNSTSLSEIKNKYIGIIGSEERDKYEFNLRKALRQTTTKPSR